MEIDQHYWNLLFIVIENSQIVHSKQIPGYFMH